MLQIQVSARGKRKGSSRGRSTECSSQHSAAWRSLDMRRLHLFPSLHSSLTHLWTVLFPQRRDEPLHCLIFHWDFIDMQVDAISQPELLQLLGTSGKKGTKPGGQIQVGHSAEHAGGSRTCAAPPKATAQQWFRLTASKRGVPRRRG